MNSYYKTTTKKKTKKNCETSTRSLPSLPRWKRKKQQSIMKITKKDCKNKCKIVIKNYLIKKKI